jgi:hypothetical protein
MKKRDLPSPDCGDALALTFAEPVIARHFRELDQRRTFAKTDYDVLAYGQ